MNIVPKGTPSPVNENTQPSSSAQDARARAIARLSAQAPVQDQNKIAPEEVGAITPAKASAEPAQEPQEEVEKDNTETPQEPVETKAKEETPLSTQYAILARKERALRAKVQEFNQTRDSFKAQQAEFESQKSQIRAEVEREFEGKVAKDPLAVLAKAGFTPEQLTNLMLNPQKVDPFVQSEMDKLREEIKALKGNVEQSSKNQQDEQTKAYQQAVAQIRSDAADLVSEDPAYETIRETQSVDDVVELIEETYKRDGVLLTVEQAAKEVEEYLVEEATKLARIKKIQQRLQPAPKTDEPKKPQQPQQMKTLTNNISSTRKLSARERAILAFEGQNKK